MIRVQHDTTFYKAFRNLKVLGYTSINDVRMLDKSNKVKASLNSKTRQEVSNGCRSMKVLEEHHSGNYYSAANTYNYYTAEMYASLFFARDTICGETNIVAGREFNVRSKSGMAKHKEQLKMLFFNPGKRIPGIPFIGNKIALFDEDVSGLYDFVIDMQPVKGQLCYVFKVSPREDLSSMQKSQIVINEMITWFDPHNWEIVARNYDLSYHAGVYDFDIHVEVEMTRFKEFLVPSVLRYNGNWDVAFKPREKGIFTARLLDFTDEFGTIQSE